MDKSSKRVIWKEKVVGEITDRKFVKRVRRSSHYLRCVGGYAIQRQIFEDLRREGVAYIEVRELDTGQTLIASITDFEKHGKLINLGHGEQIVLAEKYWHIQKNGQLVLPI